MHYTPDQLRGTVGLSKETLRYWKHVLPGFLREKCHGPVFSPGDDLAVAVPRRLTQRYGLRIGHLNSVSRCIFDVCNETPWDELIDKGLVVDLCRQTCSVVPKIGKPGLESSAVVEMLKDDFLRSSPAAARKARGHAPEDSKRLAAGGRRR